ncbi:hypothetical protein RXV86_21620 [Alisedimentitalea sp. MJ-SS2]|uniref:hypothetical protein n=1 Tax=Aliisedimentitalea sp. MJ-SS2 TaxID=3049795 RepID=UPI002910D4FC|nr:hypothetical protein [Alisedimentitalea sp. MJ-SS2]MDU8929993.1 hypothetical protein [Alisedimentitalea sp. MJ-SS2]
MRSTIYTSLFAVLLTAPAIAEPTLGCFARDYSDAHLAAHPDQIVDRIWLEFFKYPPEVFDGDDPYASVRTLTANQGHVARDGFGGQVFDGGMFCYPDQRRGGDAWNCSVDCDGGWFQIIRDDGEVLELRTRYVMVGDTETCGGAIDLAERPQQFVTYRLNRVDDAVCDAVWPDEES